MYAIRSYYALVIIHTQAGSQLNPRISVKNDRGKTVKLPDSESYARYSLPVGSIISVNEGDVIQPGTIVGKIPRETRITSYNVCYTKLLRLYLLQPFYVYRPFS